MLLVVALVFEFLFFVVTSTCDDLYWLLISLFALHPFSSNINVENIHILTFLKKYFSQKKPHRKFYIILNYKQYFSKKIDNIYWTNINIHRF